MKYILNIMLFFFIFNIIAYDFELEILSTRDDRDLNIFEYSDNIIYRQFKGTTN